MYEFHTSSYSGGQPGQECVEVATNVLGSVAVRDSKEPDGGHLTLRADAWRGFLTRVTQPE